MPSTSDTRTGTLRTFVGVGLGVLVLLAAGSWVYWLGEGSPGSPQDFRDDVAEIGLDVSWSNNGPRGGDGTVESDCGPVDVEISEIDDSLHIRWNGADEELTAETIEAVVRCTSP